MIQRFEHTLAAGGAPKRAAGGVSLRNHRTELILAGLLLLLVAGCDTGPETRSGPLPDMKFAVLPGGMFVMGSSAYGAGESPAHLVTLPGFEMLTTEVTVAQWKALLEELPEGCPDEPTLPVEGVTWFQAVSFTDALNRLDTTHTYSLPTEAQWEYACRAGSETVYCNGDPVDSLHSVGWFLDNSGGRAHPVASKQPNAWGLYDMHGNVSEWCLDYLYADYRGAPDDGSAWVTPQAQFRVRRGGGWSDYAGSCRTTARSGSDPRSGWWHFGFRVVRTVKE